MAKKEAFNIHKKKKHNLDFQIFLYELFFSIGTIMVLVGYIKSKTLTLSMGFVTMVMSLFIHGARIKKKKESCPTIKEQKTAQFAKKSNRQLTIYSILFLLCIIFFLASIYYYLWFTSIITVIFMILSLIEYTKLKAWLDMDPALRKKLEALKEQEIKAKEREREERQHLKELRKQKKEEQRIKQRQERIKRRQELQTQREARTKRRKEEKEKAKLEKAKKKLERMEKVKDDLMKEKEGIKSKRHEKTIIEVDKVRQKIKLREKYETDLDKLLDLLGTYKTLTLSEISEIFAISKKQAEEWSQMFEDHGLANLHYPPLGDPELRAIEEQITK